MLDDTRHTIAPSISFAREVREAFLAWAKNYGPQDVRNVRLMKIESHPSRP
jgi:hypothetical protein